MQNVTPSIYLINTLLPYRKDHSDGHSSNVCPDDRFFLEEVVISRKELDNKQKKY